MNKIVAMSLLLFCSVQSIYSMEVIPAHDSHLSPVTFRLFFPNVDPSLVGDNYVDISRDVVKNVSAFRQDYCNNVLFAYSSAEKSIDLTDLLNFKEYLTRQYQIGKTGSYGMLNESALAVNPHLALREHLKTMQFDRVDKLTDLVVNSGLDKNCPFLTERWQEMRDEVNAQKQKLQEQPSEDKKSEGLEKTLEDLIIQEQQTQGQSAVEKDLVGNNNSPSRWTSFSQRIINSLGRNKWFMAIKHTFMSAHYDISTYKNEIYFTVGTVCFVAAIFYLVKKSETGPGMVISGSTLSNITVSGGSTLFTIYT